MGPKDDPHCKLNDAQIATIAIMAAISFYDNQAAGCDYMRHHYGMKMIDKSGFNRRLRRLQPKLITVFRARELVSKTLTLVPVIGSIRFR